MKKYHVGVVDYGWIATAHTGPENGITDSLSLFAELPLVQFNSYRGGIDSCAVEMH